MRNEKERKLIEEFKKKYPKKHAIWREKLTKQFIEWKRKYKRVDQTQEKNSSIDKILFRLDSIEKRLSILESNNENIISDKKTVIISKKKFLRTIKSVYNSLDKRFGDFASISALTEKIKETIPWSTEQIHSELYNLFMEYKIDLQTGKKTNGEALKRDGNIFVWMKFK